MALPINLFAPLPEEVPELPEEPELPDDPDELLPLEPLLELPELDPEDEVVATPFVASQYTRAPAVTAVPVPVALAMSKTPWTAKAPLVFAGIACKAIPIRSPCNTTAPAATSEDGV